MGIASVRLAGLDLTSGSLLAPKCSLGVLALPHFLRCQAKMAGEIGHCSNDASIWANLPPLPLGEILSFVPGGRKRFEKSQVVVADLIRIVHRNMGTSHASTWRARFL